MWERENSKGIRKQAQQAENDKIDGWQAHNNKKEVKKK